ncbi:related to Los1p [Cephalotrichum gorgonifer]|uniref:Related to Los1p n=1 Tax=Cephalotrichum gorgonifer TaxID=2041049 RepID=A0AAE8N3Z8_9PEZI|nr:related to Los1p [Cephalotrichum gorgonifer]
MPPKQDVPPHIIDRTPEYEEFIEKLRAFHADRGTTFDPEPKVGTTHLDLLRVFKHIVAYGGYDKVSDEKLAWRRMAGELNLYTNNEAATAFALKEKFYKNLAAYEIKTIHGREPPPKDILEDVTAKGSGLLKRTRENFQRGAKSYGVESAASGDDGTPVRERPAAETPNSSRASRGLREAPPQRVIFQPETGPSRPTRHSSSQQGHPQQASASPAQGTPGSQHHQQRAPVNQAPSPHPHPQLTRNAGQVTGGGPINPLQQPTVPPFIAAYNPRLTTAIPLRPVDTPRTNPQAFSKAKLLAKAQAPQPGELPRVPPGSYEGANIYIRCLNALRSQCPEERSYALHHWVRISYERGEKFRFEVFPGLDEGLVEAALQVGKLYYDVAWTISWDPSAPLDVGELDGVNGTSDILERIKGLTPKDVHDNIQTQEFSDEMLRVTEAVLTIRNMVTLADNAVHIANLAPVKDLICIILNLPNRDATVEVKHYSLDIAEHITPYMTLNSDDPFYRSLLSQLDSDDRGVILTALRALGRISMNLDVANSLGHVPPSVLQNMVNWILLNDDEFTDACLDFLYQYTAVVENVDSLLRAISTENLVYHLARLLSHGARRVQKEFVLSPEKRLPSTDEIAPMPPQLRDELLQLKEPDRVHRWVKCFFDYDPESFVTQIAAWQAYNGAFAECLKQLNQPATSPADFIRSCSQIYQNSAPQVLTRGDAQQKFIIASIRARPSPLTLDGREYVKCQWASKDQPSQLCGAYFLERKDMFTHILESHLDEVADQEGRYPNEEKTFRCLWNSCTRHNKPTSLRLIDFARHVNVHISSCWPPPTAEPRTKKPRKDWVVPAKTMTVTYEETQTVRDEKNPNGPAQASGIPLSAVLVLRNIARNVGKTDAEEELASENEGKGEPGGWKERLFRPLMGRLFEVMAENRAMAPYIASLLVLVGE